MKWLSSIATALLATTTLAAPAAPPSDHISLYKLRITSSNKFLNGKLLSVNKDQIGVHPGCPPVRFYPVHASGKATDLYQLHTYPIGIVDAVIGLVGPGTLSTLTQINNPDSFNSPNGTSADWTSWKMASGDSGVGGKPNYLDYVGSSGGKWVAFPGDQKGDSWAVTWFDQTGIIPQNYMPIQVTYETAE